MQSKHCPRCARPIADADINEDRNVAFCRPCNLSMPIKSLHVSSTAKHPTSINSPPMGAWYRDDNRVKQIGASFCNPLKAVNEGLQVVPGTAAILLLVGVAVLSTLGLTGVRAPDWIPLPIREIAEKSQGCTLVIMWVFAVVFSWVGLAKLCVFGLYVAGKLEITIAEGIADVTTRVFGIGRRRPFNPAQVKGVWIEQERYTRRKKTCYRPIGVLDLVDDKPIRFGERLSDDRLEFVVAALNATLVNHPKERASASGR